MRSKNTVGPIFVPPAVEALGVEAANQNATPLLVGLTGQFFQTELPACRPMSELSLVPDIIDRTAVERTLSNSSVSLKLGLNSRHRITMNQRFSASPCPESPDGVDLLLNQSFNVGAVGGITVGTSTGQGLLLTLAVLAPAALVGLALRLRFTQDIGSTEPQPRRVALLAIITASGELSLVPLFE